MSGSSFDPRLTAYFGDPVLQSGFLPVPHLLLRHYAELGLTSHQAMFVLHLMSTTWDLGSPALNIGQLAQRMGVSRRTAQVISAELHERGLIDIFDQYDEGGAQIENGYDLSGLFQRLAAFAPAPTPSGTQRQRRERAQVSPSEQPSVTGVPQEPEIGHSQAYAAANTPPVQWAAHPPCSGLHTPHAADDTPPMQPAARLKKDLKNLPKNQQRNQKEQQGAVAAEQLNWFGREEQQEGGRSLRWDTQLSSLDVHQSRQILARIGINADVADRVAGAMHPAEIWALWLHARAAGLGIAWIARQVYDAQRKQPRMAGIPGPCEEAGRLLAVLPAETASVIIDIMTNRKSDSHELGASQTLLAADPRTAGQDLSAQVTAVWAVLDTASRSSTGPALAPVSTDNAGAHVLRVDDARWLAAKRHLATRISTSEYATWIEPLDLVHVDDTLIVVGVPNVFVRNQIQQDYATALQEALDLAWDKAVTLDVVIQQALAA